MQELLISKDTHDLFIAQAKMQRVLNLIVELYKRAYTPKQIAAFLDCSERTAYRYLKLIESIGIAIDSDCDHRFFVAQDDCPVCLRTVKEDSRDFASPAASIPGDSLVLSYGQACQLQHMNLERRLKRDLDHALMVAHHHITGDWGSYTTAAKVPEEQISIVLYKDNESLENGEPIAECLVQGCRQG